MPKHKGISALLIPTDSPGVERRPFASAHDRHSPDFNEVFLNEVRVPAENLAGPLHGGWKVANGSLGHERTLMWMAFADRLRQTLSEYRPDSELDRDRVATSVMDLEASSTRQSSPRSTSFTTRRRSRMQRGGH